MYETNNIIEILVMIVFIIQLTNRLISKIRLINFVMKNSKYISKHIKPNACPRNYVCSSS